MSPSPAVAPLPLHPLNPSPRPAFHAFATPKRTQVSPARHVSGPAHKSQAAREHARGRHPG